MTTSEFQSELARLGLNYRKFADMIGLTHGAVKIRAHRNAIPNAWAAVLNTVHAEEHPAVAPKVITHIIIVYSDGSITRLRDQADPQDGAKRL